MTSRPDPRHRIGLALPAVASLSLLAAGCGGSAKTSSVAAVAQRTSTSASVAPAASVPAPTLSASRRLLAYSACMRRNGVPSFPDPNSAGNLVLTPNDGINPASPQYERAQSACKKLSPGAASGKGMTPAQHANALAALTRYVGCMRGHAIPMAEPFSGPNGGVGIVLPRSVDPSSEQYQRADTACKRLLPATG